MKRRIVPLVHDGLVEIADPLLHRRTRHHPRITLDSVNEVQRRAGEETATVRYDAAQLARVLRIAPSPVP